MWDNCYATPYFHMIKYMKKTNEHNFPFESIPNFFIETLPNVF